MPRTKKSDQLLAKLNRSLDGEAGTTDSAKTSSDSPAANPRPRASRRRRPTADEARRSAPAARGRFAVYREERPLG